HVSSAYCTMPVRPWSHLLTPFPYTTLFRSTQALTDRYAAATDNGQILGTAWTTCRPGGPSAMVMVQGTLVVLQSDDEITISLEQDRKSTRLNSSHVKISYAVFCLKNKRRPC